jgi:hypothetical protein
MVLEMDQLKSVKNLIMIMSLMAVIMEIKGEQILMMAI